MHFFPHLHPFYCFCLFVYFSAREVTFHIIRRSYGGWGKDKSVSHIKGKMWGWKTLIISVIKAVRGGGIRIREQKKNKVWEQETQKQLHLIGIYFLCFFVCVSFLIITFSSSRVGLGRAKNSFYMWLHNLALLSFNRRRTEKSSWRRRLGECCGQYHLLFFRLFPTSPMFIFPFPFYGIGMVLDDIRWS